MIKLYFRAAAMSISDLWSDITGVLLHPRTTFEEIIHKKSWGIYLVCFVTMLFGFGILTNVSNCFRLLLVHYHLFVSDQIPFNNFINNFICGQGWEWENRAFADMIQFLRSLVQKSPFGLRSYAIVFHCSQLFLCFFGFSFCLHLFAKAAGFQSTFNQMIRVLGFASIPYTIYAMIFCVLPMWINFLYQPMHWVYSWLPWLWIPIIFVAVIIRLLIVGLQAVCPKMFMRTALIHILSTMAIISLFKYGLYLMSLLCWVYFK